MTLQLGPIQTIRMNFSRLDSLSFAYCTRAYAYDALLSSSWSRSSGSPPDPVAVSFSLSERSDCVSREQMGVACSVHMCVRQRDPLRVRDGRRRGHGWQAHLVVEQKPVRVRLVRADVLVRCEDRTDGTIGGRSPGPAAAYVGPPSRLTFVDLRIGEVGHGERKKKSDAEGRMETREKRRTGTERRRGGVGREQVAALQAVVRCTDYRPGCLGIIRARSPCRSHSETSDSESLQQSQFNSCEGTWYKY